MSQKISAMANASTPLTGAELVPIVQGGVNKKATVLELSAINNLQYQGTWAADTNTPALTSSVGTAGYYYIVNVAGTTTLNGISSWAVGDWAVFSNTGVWQKISGGAQSSIQVSNDTNSATTYNLTMTTLSSGYMATTYVDGGDLTYIPSTGTLSVPNLLVSGSGLDFTGANNALYFNLGDNRVTLANYNVGGHLVFEVNGGAYTAQFYANQTYQFNFLYSATVSASPRALFVDSSGFIGYVTSTRASKANIAPMENVNWVDQLNPVTFNYRKKDENGGYTEQVESDLEYGLVAEDVEAVNRDLCMYNIEGKLVGVKYDRLVVPLLKKIQKLEARLALLESSK
jgi:hypothetical protein